MKNILTNRDISENYRDYKFWLMRSALISEFAKWVVSQSPYTAPVITGPVAAWAEYVGGLIESGIPKSFTYDELNALITSEIFESMLDILALNEPRITEGEGYMNRHTGPKNPDYDFIDLGALARNVFYGILRECITEGTYEIAEEVAA